MTRILYGHDEDVAAFVAALLDMPRGFGPCRAVGFLDHEGRLEAGVVYSSWVPEAGTIEISAAAIGHKWGTRERLRLIFGIPFDRYGCRMVVARTSERNPIPLRIWRKLGADEYRIPELRGPGEAEIITTLSVDQWRRSRFHEQPHRENAPADAGAAPSVSHADP